MRPRTVEEFVGQTHFFGPGKLLRRMLQADRLSSLIFYGPPGTGKTALAHVIANHTHCQFRPLNAVAAGIKDVREVLHEATAELETTGRRTILFVDELHRFNRAQQDVLLPDVEEGRVILIGATTQNPFFAINSPLLSRSQIFTFEPLTCDEIKTLLLRAVSDRERGLGDIPIHLAPEALDFLAEVSDGDARRALTALEVGVLSSEQRPVEFTLEVARDSIQRKALDYDATGDAHYDVASAFIKSMRGSDPDAAIYWMARMLEAGEDPRFIARRVVICASEDVGNADPRALLVAAAAVQATEFVGLPECQLALAQAVTYIATAPKSNASTLAIAKAREDVREGRTLPVPEHLRDASYRGAEKLGRGQGYQYSHDFPEGYVAQQYLPEERRYYEPVDRGYEAEIRQRLEALRSKPPNASPRFCEPRLSGGHPARRPFAFRGGFREALGDVAHNVVGWRPRPAALHVHVALVVDVVDPDHRTLSAVRGADGVPARLAAVAEADFGGEPLEPGQVRQGRDVGEDRSEAVAIHLLLGQAAVARPAVALPPERDQIAQAVQHAPVRGTVHAITAAEARHAHLALDQVDILPIIGPRGGQRGRERLGVRAVEAYDPPVAVAVRGFQVNVRSRLIEPKPVSLLCSERPVCARRR
jgi:putative ATPase